MNSFDTKLFFILTFMLMILMFLSKQSMSYTDSLFFIIQVNMLIVLNRINSKIK